MRHVETVSPAGCQVTAVAEHMKRWAGGGEPLGPGQPWVTPPPPEKVAPPQPGLLSPSVPVPSDLGIP